MFNFEKLNVYNDAVSLSLDIYRLTKNYPKDELFGLSSQIRRAAVSISLNIAEGSSRTKKDFSHFLDMARGSCYELVPLLKISFELKYISSDECQTFYAKVDDLTRRINALKKSINR